jgi:long-chain fatty acid transport protein
MKKIIQAVATVAFLLLASRSFATNGHQLSAIGAYQQGMAGAVTAAPYDSSTAITNPAGMAVIGNRTDFSFQGFSPSRQLSFAYGGGTSEGGSGFYLVPAIGWTAPVNGRRDLFFGGGMYGVSGMGVDYDAIASPMLEAPFGPFDPGTAKAHIYSQYQFWKMAPTLAWKLKTLAVGFALNLDYQAFGFKNMFTGTMGGTPMKFGMDLSEMQGALGAGATIGFIYQPVPVFGVGMSYASKQYFTDFKWRLAAGDVSNVYDVNGNPVSSTDGIYTMKLNFPQQAALGIAIRPFSRLLWTVDAKWINFHDSYKTVKLKGDFGASREVPLEFGWDDVVVYASALQFDVTDALTLRAGFNYSNSPIKPEDVDNNMSFPAIVKRRASGGFTYRLGKRWELTMAYMKAFKEELTSDSGSGTRISLEENAADVEISYRF